jgi:hypothetical protein
LVLYSVLAIQSLLLLLQHIALSERNNQHIDYIENASKFWERFFMQSFFEINFVYICTRFEKIFLYLQINKLNYIYYETVLYKKQV